MAAIVRMPAPLAGASDGIIHQWLVQVGQAVAAGDPLAEIETEKAVVELATETAGTVGRLLAAQGQTVAVGEPIAALLGPGEGEAELTAALDQAGAAQSAPVPAAAGSGVADTAGADTAGADTAGAAVPAGGNLASPAARTGTRLLASPIVRRLARETGIDLSAISGTGPGGRIVRRDFEAAVRESAARGPAAAPSPATGAPAPATGPGPAAPAHAAPMPRPIASTTAAPTPGSGPAPGTEPAAGAPGAANGADYEPHPADGPTERVPLTPMRRAIARRMTESTTFVPHFFVTRQIRTERLRELQREINEQSEVKVSLNDLVLKACGLALRRVPAANAVWAGDQIVRFAAANVAMAIALDGGLVTPVLRGIDELSITEVARATSDFVARAQAGRLTQAELTGGSFTVSNLGMFGVEEFSAIINPPQSGIVAIGAIKQRPVADAEGKLSVGSTMNATLSADHRVIDGAVAAEWLAAFAGLIEHPLGILA